MDLKQFSAAVLMLAILNSCVERKVNKLMTEAKPNSGELIAGCRISIAKLADLSEFQSGTVTLEIVFKNEGSATVQFPRTSLWFDYDFSVLTAAGAEVSMTAFGKRERENLDAGAAAAILDVASRKEYRSTVEISRLYDLVRPASYTVRASKVFRDPASHEFVTVLSNRLAFTVHSRQ